jgi:2-oxoglutarate ferredoxin oxidoreductase subunit delta
MLAVLVQMNIVISPLVREGDSETRVMVKKAKAIVVDPKLCKGCQICISVCPHGVLKKSEVVDNRGFFLPRIVDLEACKVCKLCEMECPDFAISVAAIEE